MTTASTVPRARSCPARSGWSRRSPKTGRVAEATARLDDLLALASPLGLYAEELDPVTGDHLGNYPQALTHAAMIQSALAIHDAQRELAVDDSGRRET